MNYAMPAHVTRIPCGSISERLHCAHCQATRYLVTETRREENADDFVLAHYDCPPGAHS